MSQAIYSVKLTDSEILLLDGKVSGEVQAEIDKCKFAVSLQSNTALSDKQRKLISEIVHIAKTTGRLTRMERGTKHCPSCQKDAGYYLYPRSGRHHRKGDKNYDKPKSLRGYDYDRGLVGITNTIFHGCCTECQPVFEPALKEALLGVEAELPPQLAWGTTFKRWDKMKCECCGWQGHEGQMGTSPTIMGDRRYRSTCPGCGVVNTLFNTKVKADAGFTLVKLAEVVNQDAGTKGRGVNDEK